MDYKHLVTEESVRESLIAISNEVHVEIAYLPKTENAKDIADDTITNAKIKTREELRLELISIASLEPSSDYNSNDDL